MTLTLLVGLKSLIKHGTFNRLKIVFNFILNEYYKIKY